MNRRRQKMLLTGKKPRNPAPNPPRATCAWHIERVYTSDFDWVKMTVDGWALDAILRGLGVPAHLLRGDV